MTVLFPCTFHVNQHVVQVVGSSVRASGLASSAVDMTQQSCNVTAFGYLLISPHLTVAFCIIFHRIAISLDSCSRCRADTVHVQHCAMTLPSFFLCQGAEFVRCFYASPQTCLGSAKSVSRPLLISFEVCVVPITSFCVCVQLIVPPSGETFPIYCGFVR